jgi:hypothetical protein
VNKIDYCPKELRKIKLRTNKCKVCGTPIYPVSTVCNKHKGFGRVHSEETKQKMRGRVHTQEERVKISLSKIGELNPQWQGDNVTYGALHDWVKWHKIKPVVCSICNKDKRLDLANISGTYKRDLDDWEYICRRCHMVKDGRLYKLTKVEGLNYEL